MTTSSDTTVELTVEALSEYGEGISFWQGYEVYLQGVLPGETALVQIGDPFTAGTKRRPGTVISVIKKSECRRQKVCPYSEKCGGCPLGLMNYESQLMTKRGLVINALNAAGISEDNLFSYVKSPVTSFWRNKSIRYFAKDDKGCLTSGFFASRSHQLVQITSCEAEPVWFGDVSEGLCSLFSTLGFSSHGKTSRGLRALLLRDCSAGRLGLLISSRDLSQSEFQLLRDFAALHNFASFSFLLNQNEGNALLQGRMRLIYGQDTVTTIIGPFSYEVGPQTFLQVNHTVTEELYNDAIAWCGSGTSALDLCCGIGTMTLRLALNFAKVTGIEIVSASCAAALKNARKNGLDNVDFVTADIRKGLGKWIRPDIDAVIADPSRAGLGEESCSALGKLKSGSRLCYIFCSLTALKRDIPVLLRNGFTVSKVKAYDMFPYSLMTETAVFMVKK